MLNGLTVLCGGGGGGQLQMACIDFIPAYIHISVLYLPYFGSLDMLLWSTQNMCVLCLTDGLDTYKHLQSSPLENAKNFY